MEIGGLLQDWGLPDLFLGGVLEGEGAAFAGGVMAHRGLFSYPAAALFVSAGAFCIDQLLILLGRRLHGTERVQRALSQPRIQKLARPIAAHPVLWVMLLRWVYGLRTGTAMLIGVSGAPVVPVLIAGVASALLWGFVVTGIGYYFAQGLSHMLGPLAESWHFWALAVGGLAVAIAGGIVLRRRARRSE